MIRWPALFIFFAIISSSPHTARAFDEIDQIGNNNFKPMRGCSNCHLRRVSPSGDLRWIGAVLPKTQLSKADLRNADMRGANFRAANLRQADLRNANISGADFRNADLTGADLTGANLFKANLSGVKFGSVRFCKTTMPDGSVDNSGCDTPSKIVRPHTANAIKSKNGKWVSFLGFRINLP